MKNNTEDEIEKEKKRRKNENSKRWNKENRDRLLITNTRWRENHKEEYKKYQLEYQRKRWINDPEYREKKLQSNRRWAQKNPELKKLHSELSLRKILYKKPELEGDWLEE